MARTAYCTLSLKSIFQYGECNENSRNFEEGERVINARHILIIGRRPSPDHIYEIYSLVVQTSGLYDSPHKIEGTIEKKNLKIHLFSCTCKSGSSKCKHIIATLLHCNR